MKLTRKGKFLFSYFTPRFCFAPFLFQNFENRMKRATAGSVSQSEQHRLGLVQTAFLCRWSKGTQKVVFKAKLLIDW